MFTFEPADIGVTSIVTAALRFRIRIIGIMERRAVFVAKYKKKKSPHFKDIEKFLI